MGPLDKYLSVLWEGQDYTQEHYDKIDLQREELMAECMAKEGFEYVPNANSGTTVMSDDDQEGPAWDSLEFAQQYGYGVFDWPGSSGPDEAPVDEEIYVDPNEDYVNSLSPSEQEAFYATLYGDPEVVNRRLDEVRSLTVAEVADAARRYLQPEQRAVLSYRKESA